jgi:hypothetical protein
MFNGEHHSERKIGHMRMAPQNVTQSAPIDFDRTVPIRASDKKYHTR